MIETKKSDIHNQTTFPIDNHLKKHKQPKVLGVKQSLFSY